MKRQSLAGLEFGSGEETGWTSGGQQGLQQLGWEGCQAGELVWLTHREHTAWYSDD